MTDADIKKAVSKLVEEQGMLWSDAVEQAAHDLGLTTKEVSDVVMGGWLMEGAG